jgi:hypothetical protein
MMFSGFNLSQDAPSLLAVEVLMFVHSLEIMFCTVRVHRPQFTCVYKIRTLLFGNFSGSLPNEWWVRLRSIKIVVFVLEMRAQSSHCDGFPSNVVP